MEPHKKEQNLTCEQILEEFHNACSRTCKKDGSCIKYVQLYLDNMACKNKDAFFLEGTKNCKPCSEYLQIHDCIKKNLKSKVETPEIQPSFFDQVLEKCVKNIQS